ncbi:MAG: B12-binding domain-containing radical SAM protein, partial [Desulfobacterales bacterium]|nr:B12-binding domain-containing radical SAM protein [Desulfobacterales bacterium]
MNIILINPPASKILEEQDITNRPHLGLAYLAAVLMENGFNPKAIDARFENISLPKVVRQIKGYTPDIIGITAMTNMIVDAHNLAKTIKELFPKALIVIGGPHASAMPEEVLAEFSCFDIAVFGEGEITFLELVQAYRSISFIDELFHINGIAFRHNKKIIRNNPRPFISNLDSLPLPAWDIFPPSKRYGIMLQRGCPGRCNFCMRVLGDTVRHRSPENVFNEIKILVEKYSVTDIGFIENFGLHQGYTHKLLDMMIEHFPNIKWDTPMRVTSMNEELIKKMKKAGCERIAFGVESGDSRILKNSQKGIDLKKAIAACQIAKRYHIRTTGFFILGHPNETKDSAKKTIDLIAKMNLDEVSIGIMVPYPGTEIYKLAKAGKNGYIMISNNWKDFNKQIGNALELKGLNRKELERLQLLGYLKLYLSNFRIIELLKIVYRYKILAFSIVKKLLT